MRAQIRDEICAIQPLDAVEREHLAEALAWVDSGAALCRIAKPATPPIHLVSYFVVVDDEHVLLVDHRNAQRWLPTGGHVEPGEHPRATVVRELREELGVSPTHEIDAPIMLTRSTTVGLTTGHVDMSLWYVVRGNLDQPITFDISALAAVRVSSANAHVHWHIVPLPSGTPYEKQQLAIYELDILRQAAEERDGLAARLRERIRREVG